MPHPAVAEKLELKLLGKKVFLHKSYYADFKALIEKFVVSEGGEVCDEVTEDICVALVTEKASPARKQIEKLVRQGANITLLGAQRGTNRGILRKELLACFLPHPSETVRLLRAGEFERITRFQELGFNMTAEPGGPFDLTGADLSRIILTAYPHNENRRSGRMIIDQCNLTNSEFNNCSFGQVKGADFTGSHLFGIWSTEFEDCNFTNCTWTESDSYLLTFKNCEFENSNFRCSWLVCVNFAGSDLSRINFSDANLACSDFSNANLDNADFSGANTSRANFSNTTGTATGLLVKAESSLPGYSAEAKETFAEMDRVASGTDFEINVTLRNDQEIVLVTARHDHTFVNGKPDKNNSLFCFSRRHLIGQSIESPRMRFLFPSTTKAFEHIASTYRNFQVDFDDLKVKVGKPESGAKFRYLTYQCICQALGIGCPNEAELKKQSKQKNTTKPVKSSATTDSVIAKPSSKETGAAKAELAEPTHSMPSAHDEAAPRDFSTFLEILPKYIDRVKLKKAISMLKSERFQLFAEVKNNCVVGIVKSQNDPDLLYSCQLTDDGSFSCGTQNLNACGGLRGSLCKHLLVLLLGLTKACEIDPEIAYSWSRASRSKQPKLDKELTAETFLRYRASEAGEIDWRPTETTPEDYYAF